MARRLHRPSSRLGTGLARVGSRALDRLFQHAKRLPFLRERIAAEYDKLLGELRRSAKPYADELPRTTTLPEHGR
ncbi:MAG: hypothetical protein IAG13_36220, partial [Deltaproteobacteria bacterium]|nr:hypothetical protein [Nannocystaceae bacterium]